MDYQDLASKAVFEIAQQLCWDSMSYQKQAEFLDQAKEIWNKKILSLVVESVNEVEENYR
jgi:hypothetical protein